MTKAMTTNSCTTLTSNFRCRASKDCLGFLIDYGRGSCSRVESNSADVDNRKDLREEAGKKVNLFQKVCLQGKRKGGWANSSNSFVLQ